MSPLCEQLRRSLTGTLPARGALVVGVSGGADSVALLHLLLECRPDLRPRLRIAHVHHGLRSRAADQDERLVRRLSKSLEIPSVFYASQVSQVARKLGMSLEAAGRLVRHDCFLDAARQFRAAAVLLAHHQDDQAETLLFNLLRGAGGQGLSALRAARSYPHPQAPRELKLLRPLLEVSKAELKSYCCRHKIPWREDRSNRDPAFTRNRLRRQLIPQLEREYNANLRPLLANSAKILSREDAFLDNLTQRHLRRLIQRQTPDLLALDRPGFIRLEPAVRFRAAALVWDLLRIPQKSFTHLERLLRAAEQGHAGLSLPGGWSVFTTSGRIWFQSQARVSTPRKFRLAVKPGLNQNQTCPFGVEVKTIPVSRKIPELPRNSEHILIDAAAFRPPWTLRSWQPGDYFSPLGMGGRKKDVKKVFSEMKLKANRKQHWPLLVKGREIMWIYQGPISEKIKMSAHTKRALRIKLFQVAEVVGREKKDLTV